MLLTSFDPFAQEFTRRAFGSADYRRLARMDAIRRENDIELRFDLPGIDPESIDVTVDRGVLTVKASRQRGVHRGREAVHPRAGDGLLLPPAPSVRRG